MKLFSLERFNFNIADTVDTNKIVESCNEILIQNDKYKKVIEKTISGIREKSCFEIFDYYK